MTIFDENLILETLNMQKTNIGLLMKKQGRLLSIFRKHSKNSAFRQKLPESEKVL